MEQYKLIETILDDITNIPSDALTEYLKSYKL